MQEYNCDNQLDKQEEKWGIGRGVEDGLVPLTRPLGCARQACPGRNVHKDHLGMDERG